MKIILSILVSFPLLAAVRVDKISVTNAQAIIEYTAPDAQACTLKVADLNLNTPISSAVGNGSAVTVTCRGLQCATSASQVVYVEGKGTGWQSAWGGWQTVASVASDGLSFTFTNSTSGTFTADGSTVPWGNVGALVNDVNTALFSGSNLDSRTGNLSRFRSRVFVLGDRIKVEAGSDNRNYSRALQAISRHVGSLACAGGSDVSADFFFNTGNISLGNYAMVDWNGVNGTQAGTYMMPTFNPSGMQERPSGVALEHVIEPMSGLLTTNGSLRQEAIDFQDFALTASNTTLDPTSPAEWTNPSNMLSVTDSGAYASYTGTGQAPVCIKPNDMHSYANSDEGSYPGYTRLHTKYWDSFQLTFKGAYAVTGSGSDRDLEVALSFDGCRTASTPWRTVALTNSSTPADVLFPAAAIPKAGFQDWINPGDPIPSKIEIVTWKQNNVTTDGTSALKMPDNSVPANGYWVYFKPHWKYNASTGTTIRVGATLADCSGGTAYTLSSYTNPKRVDVVGTVGAGSPQNVCVQQFGVMVRKKTATNNEIRIGYVNLSSWESYAPGPDSSGSRKRTTFLPVTDGSGNIGYLWQAGSNGIYWVSKDNAETRRVMGNWLNAKSSQWDAGFCNVDGISFSLTDPYTFTCSRTLGANSVPLRITIHDTRSNKWTASPAIGIFMYPECSNPATPSPNPCIEIKRVLGDGTYSLSDLVKAKYPLFNQTLFPRCELTEPEGSVVPLRCLSSVQDTSAWLGVWDYDKLIENYNPSDQTTNPVIGMLAPNIMNFGVMHFHQMLTTNSMLVSPKPGRQYDGAYQSGDGPFVLRTGTGGPGTETDRAINNTTDVVPCSSLGLGSNTWGFTNCTQLDITSEPFDPDPTSPSTGDPGEFGAFLVGNTFQIAKCVSSGALSSDCFGVERDAGRIEDVRILSRSGTNPIHVVIGRGKWVGSPMLNFSATSPGPRLFAGGAGGDSAPLSAGFAVWDFRTSPDGTNPVAFQGSLHSSDHGSCTNLDCFGVTEAGIENHPAPNAAKIAALGENTSTEAYGHFNYKGGMRFATIVENYLSNTQVAANQNDPRMKFAANSRPTFRQAGADNLWSKVGGTTYIYSTPQLWDVNYKGLPYMAYSSDHPLLEVSGSTALLDTSADNYKFCFAWRAGDCWLGSKHGEIYANIPFINPIDSSGYFNCPNMEYREDNGICVAVRHPMTDGANEYHAGFSHDMGQGAHFRHVTNWWSRNTRGGVFNDPKIFSTGEWYGPLVSHFALNSSSAAFFQKIPLAPAPDGIDRRFWVPVPITVGSTPTGTVVMQVEFGYQELSDLSTGKLRCTRYDEPCYATSKNIPLPFGPGDGTAVQTGYANRYGGDYTPVATTPATFTFAGAGHGLGADSRVEVYGFAAGAVSITDANTFTVPSVTLPNLNQRYLTFQRQDSPWLYSGDGCGSITSASNTTPIHVRCANEHRMQSGNRIFITGVSGNANANGFFTARWTGNATLDLYDNNGNAIAGSGSGTGGTFVPGGQGCDAGCTVTIPALSNRVLWYRRRYLNSSGAVIFTTPLQAIATP